MLNTVMRFRNYFLVPERKAGLAALDEAGEVVPVVEHAALDAWGTGGGELVLPAARAADAPAAPGCGLPRP